MRDPATRGALEASARALVLERYDWSAVAGQLEDALLRMARASASEVREGARLRASVGAGL